MIKLIADVRFFESKTIPKGGGFPRHLGTEIYKISGQEFVNAIPRFVLGLRERKICLPDFNHVYVCVTE